VVNKIISKGKEIFVSPQTGVLSAASVIMLMIIASRFLGLVRQRVLAHFFAPSELSLFFAAFRLPDLVFEVLVFGTFSSAFIPVFTKTLKKGEGLAWSVAASVVNLGLIIFVALSLLISFSASHLYSFFAPGFTGPDRETIVELTRVLFAAQGFFVVSYVLTGVLESLRRFLVPALAPLFYNLGIIFGTLFLSPSMGLLGPSLGVFIGAVAHFLIQLPLAMKLGFRFAPVIKITDEVKKIARLALPRIIEVSFLQVSKTAELFFASLITTASYTYYTFGNSLQLLPVALFGTAISKAALPTLSREAEDLQKFKKTLTSAVNQIVFLVLPFATLLIVLRIPLVRLVYGTDIFSWDATVQTGWVVSTFAAGIVFQATASLLARAFYALHDTKTPVVISVISILLTISLDYVFIRALGLPVWGLAAAFSIGVALQSIGYFYFLGKKLEGFKLRSVLIPVLKVVLACLGSGAFMYILLKVFDRSVWVKRLSFLGRIEATKVIPFEKFVLDTRYTINLLLLTLVVSLLGALVYLGILVLVRSNEVFTFLNLAKRIIIKRKISPIPQKEEESLALTPKEQL